MLFCLLSSIFKYILLSYYVVMFHMLVKKLDIYSKKKHHLDLHVEFILLL